MEPYTTLEITQMRAAFNSIEAAYVLMEDNLQSENFQQETKEHRRLNKKLVEELAKKKPDHEKIYFLLNAINNVQNEQQQTTAAKSSEEEPESEKINWVQRWFKKSNQTRK